MAVGNDFVFPAHQRCTYLGFTFHAPLLHGHTAPVFCMWAHFPILLLAYCLMICMQTCCHAMRKSSAPKCAAKNEEYCINTTSVTHQNHMPPWKSEGIAHHPKRSVEALGFCLSLPCALARHHLKKVQQLTAKALIY